MGILQGGETPAHAPADSDIREIVRELAGRLAELEERTANEDGSAPAERLSDAKLAMLADAIYRTRQRRMAHFDRSLFAEPAWDMLLDLFVNAVRGVRVCTVSLCLAAAVPQATGLRWIKVLQKQGLVRRHRAPDDGRLMVVEITPTGFQLMRRCISDGVLRCGMPALD